MSVEMWQRRHIHEEEIVTIIVVAPAGVDTYLAQARKREKAANRKTERACHARPDDHRRRFTPTPDGHGRQAKCHYGSDGEACLDDEVVESGFLATLGSDRTMYDNNNDDPDELPDEYHF